MNLKSLTFLSAIALIAMMLALPTRGFAREGFWVGGGFARASVDGGIDGDLVFCVDLGCAQLPVVIPGKLENGNGLVFSMGYGFNDNVALEYLSTHTAHDASHQILPAGTTQTANLSTHLIGTKFMASLSDSWELIGRIGLGLYSLRYANSTVKDWNAALDKSEFKGRGVGFGTGLEYYFESLSMEFSLTQHAGKLRTLSADSVSGSIPSTSILITTIGFSLNYHFN